MNKTALTRIGKDFKEEAIKFLGIYIDEFLTWKYHLTLINNKIAQALFSIKQVKRVLPKECLRTLYFALIHPHYTYGILAWGNCRPAYNSHTDPLFKSNNILKLTDLYEYQAVLFVYDFISNNLLPSFAHTFAFNRDMSNQHITRQSNLLYVAKCQSQFASKLPLFSLPIIWNKWAKVVPRIIHKYSIKHHLKTKLLDSYQNKVKCDNVRCSECR